MHRSLRMGTGALDSHSINTLRSGPYEGKIAGLYDLEETLGRGHFAVVKLARHVFTGEKVAVKVIDKTKLDDVSKAHLLQEVRCMKLVQHPNVVRLYEVIDTATKLYLILELGDGGDLYDYIMRHDTGLSEQLAKEYFRQIVRAISYCHQLHVVHRDLKPENVVFFEKLGVVKLTDFGFSNKFCPGQKLETSCGSLAYSAPEILLGDSYDAPAVDIWSLGVILFMLVCGQAPFQEANDSETLTMIMDCKYNVPSHVSKNCRDLIARMLVRNPEKRATLNEITNHLWLAADKEDNQPLDVLPLVSREQLSEDDHNVIVQKIVNGKIATKDEIQDCLDKNEYNHITATYYLLAERKLRSKRQDQINKSKRPEILTVPNNTPIMKRGGIGSNIVGGNGDTNGVNPNPCLLTVPRTPGDVPQRSRKCSIVQEDEEEEDISTSISGREELALPLNRRGSRSEGRLNLAVQERLECERRKPEIIDKEKLIRNAKDDKLAKPLSTTTTNLINKIIIQNETIKDKDNNKMIKTNSLLESPIKMKLLEDMKSNNNIVTTTVLTESSTISIPIITTSPPIISDINIPPKYKTMPSPTRSPQHQTNISDSVKGNTNRIDNNTSTSLQLNEIFEEGEIDSSKPISRQFVSRNQNRANYEQRRSKFHKARTASCSSSDASDDDSEKRKKRAHKLNTTTVAKPFQGRRDSHDDSSDSQEPGNSGTTTSAGPNKIGSNTTTTNVQNNKNGNTSSSSSTNNNSGNSGGRKNTNSNNILLGRRHKCSRRRNGETRLRESQSLNRITEVQEDGSAHALVIATSVVGTQGIINPSSSILVSSKSSTTTTSANKSKSISARILQGLNMSRKTNDEEKSVIPTTTTPNTHISRKDTMNINQCENNYQQQQHHVDEKENLHNKTAISLKKMRFLGKYFHVHKKLCIPLPGLFNRNRLYKAQSCSSLNRDKINFNPDTIRCRQRAVSVVRTNDGDINQNDHNILLSQRKQTSTVVQLNNVCNELTGICAIHLGQASKCCSFC